jgi:hypothetical protein
MAIGMIHTKSKLPSGTWHVFALAAGTRPNAIVEKSTEMSHIGDRFLENVKSNTNSHPPSGWLEREICKKQREREAAVHEFEH